MRMNSTWNSTRAPTVEDSSRGCSGDDREIDWELAAMRNMSSGRLLLRKGK